MIAKALVGVPLIVFAAIGVLFSLFMGSAVVVGMLEDDESDGYWAFHGQ